MGGERTQALAKPLEDSPMIQEENNDISFRVSKLEDLFKGSVRIFDLFNLEKRMEKRMGNMEENGIKWRKGWDICRIQWDLWRIILWKGLLSSYKIHRKIFLKVMMWPRVVRKIKIVLMMINPPLICLLQEHLILIIELIGDVPHVVSNSLRLTRRSLMERNI